MTGSGDVSAPPTVTAKPVARPDRPSSDPAPSLGELLRRQARQHGERPFLFARGDGGWPALTYRQVDEIVDRAAAALVAHGIKPGERVGILSENRPEWFLADLATLRAGCVDVPLYSTSPAAEIAPILRRSGARMLFLSGTAQRDKLDEILAAVPTLEGVVSFDEPPARLPLRFDQTWDEWLETGTETARAELSERAMAVTRDDLATLLFTSGTTGEPKGVMLTHGNFLANVESILQHIDIGEDDRTLSFLPLSHCFERTAGHYTLLAAGGQIAYASHLDRVALELREIPPTLVLGVPRFFEKMQSRVLATVEKSHPYRRRLFHYALRVGRRALAARFAERELTMAERWRMELADRLVFSRLRERLGGRVRLLVSGGAPLDAEITEFFLAVGLCLCEGYGLTETSPVIACNQPPTPRAGSVGRVVPEVDVRIADDGEIVVRGPNVMRGYFEDPDATAEVLDDDGTFHTGDVGELDEDGFLRITDRKKDLIITAGGKNVSPAAVEGVLKRSPWIADLCLIGDRRPYLVALVVPEFATLKRHAEQLGIEWTDRPSMLRHPDLCKPLREIVAEANAQLAPPERVRRFSLLETGFSQENKTLTATLKVRRHEVARVYEQRIEELYQAHPPEHVLQPPS